MAEEALHSSTPPQTHQLNGPPANPETENKGSASLRVVDYIMSGGERPYKMLSVFMVLFIASLLLNSVIASHSTPSESLILASNMNPSARKLQFQGAHKRMLIGSTAPTCTYNECRGCKYRCRAEQIPVDGNDPLNSAYRYKCVCHR